MDVKIWINEILFNNNQQVLFDINDIVVFVGPNNAGKSASLKEISSLLNRHKDNGKVIKQIKYTRQGNETELLAFLESFSIKELGGTLMYYKGLGYNIYEQNALNYWENEDKGISDLANVFASSLTTEERLQAANPATNIRLIANPPEHPIHFLQKNDTLEKAFSEYFQQAFGLDLIVHRNAGSEVPLYVGIAPTIQHGEDRLSESYQNELEKLDLLHKQGDGMRSFVGVLLHAFISHKSIFFIDEPEAFLHPPQARLLGKMLAKDLPTDRQLFLATHSTDFLKGLLDSNNSNLKIIRIQRDGQHNNISVLKNSEINAIWSDSLLRHSNVLDGLFHSQVIICESDSDNRFFSAMLSAVNEEQGKLSPDTLFLHCGGKHRIPTIIKALKQLNVVIKIITDFDVLNDVNPLKEIYEQSGGNWVDVENDWKIVKAAIESKRPELETSELKNEIDTIFTSTTERIMPKDKIGLIQKSLRKASAWSHAKSIGKSFIPSGDAIIAFEKIQTCFKEKGFFIVEIGELESFAKSVGSHGPKWVNDVLTKDLINDPELKTARDFISLVTS
jgi:AAA15 family ATPase/GTPase